MVDVLKVLGTRDIYSWRTKSVHDTVGLLDLIGGEQMSDDIEPEIKIGSALSKSLWHTKCAVYGVELFMEVGKIHLRLVATLNNYPEITLNFGIWILIPNNKQKYMEAYHSDMERKSDMRKHKRKRNGDNNEYTIKVHHDLLKSRSLAEFLGLTLADGYIQLGDVQLSWSDRQEATPNKKKKQSESE